VRRSTPPPTAYAYLLRLLTVRDRTERELRGRLARKGYVAAEADAAMERVRALGYLDDARFAKGRAEGLLSRGRLGPRAVQARLSASGIDRPAAQAAVARAMEGRDELDLARVALQRKHPLVDASSDPKLRARAMRFLLGRGFSAGIIARVLRVEVEEDQG
jgi:regulatory protein